MNNKLNIQDLVSALAERYGMDTKSATTFVRTIFEIIEEYITKDKLVKIKGLGTFKLISVSDRESVNVNTGERILIAGHSKLSFTPDAALKDAVNRPFSDFETTVLRDTTSTEDMERIPSAELAANREDAEAEADADEGANEETSVVVEENVPGTATDDVGQSDENQYIEVWEESPQESAPSAAEMEAEGSIEVPATPQAEVVEEAHNATAEPSVPVAADAASSADDANAHDNQQYPMASDSIIAPENANHHSHGWAYALLTLILMAVSYVGGHYRVLSMLEVSLYPEADIEEQPIIKPVGNTGQKAKQPSDDMVVSQQDTVSAARDIVQQDTVSIDSATVKTQPAQTQERATASMQENTTAQTSEDDPAKVAKYYPQVPGGSYWIVGDAGHVHCMEVGETLYRVAKKELGSQDFVRYLIVFNEFEDPNIIHTGDTIRIPKLVKK